MHDNSALSKRQQTRRREILAAASELFLREGYGRTSMDKVHALVGGSKRTLYSHFPSKDALFEAIIARVSERVMQALDSSAGGSDLRTTLTHIGRGYLNALLSPDGLALYRAMVSEAPHFPDMARRFFDEGLARASANLAAFFREQKRRGRLNVRDPQVAAEQFLGMVRGDLHLAAVYTAVIPSRQVVERTVVQAVDTFLGGVEATPTRA